MSKKVAFLTIEDTSGFVIYDHLAIPELLKKNITTKEVPWTKPTDWAQFDAVIIRSTWDYQQKITYFLEVLHQISSQTLLLNSLEVVLWNRSKIYLQELFENQFSTVPTLFLNHWDVKKIQSAFEKFTTNELVIKPQISANADDTYVVKVHDFQNFSLNFDGKVLMIQPYLPEIQLGEVSVFYFDSKYSHAVLKKPKQNDFRVQEEHGGIISTYNPPNDLLSICDKFSLFLNEKFGNLLYARYDFVNVSGKWFIMELELIEPSFYFPYHENSTSNFADAVEKFLTK